MWPNDSLPQRGNTNWKFFYASGNDWQVYTKPPGVSMLYILIIAAGGGGSRTVDGNVTSAGGGGGSGGMTRLLIPAAFLPDTIYVRPGLGGLGATAANTQGTAGGTSYVSIAPTTASSNTIISQGGALLGASPVSAGGGGLASSVAISTFATLGIFNSVAGQNGTAGANSANGSATGLTAGVSGSITSGGTGGGNGTGFGGNITSFAAGGFVPTMTQSARGSGGGGFDGFQRGLIIGAGLKSTPLFFTGGCGGNGVSTAVTAGRGGDAGYGGGGGGGGGGTNAGSVSGDGGNGGDGLIIIGSL